MHNFFLIFFSCSLLFVNCEIANNELKMVIEFYRHGARVPFDNTLYPSNWTGYFLGELTPVGKRQHYILGEQLRERYIVNNSFLSAVYNPSEIFVSAHKGHERTIDSAQAHMLGFYPAGTQQQIPAGLDLNLTFPPWEGLNKSEFNFGLNSTPERIQMIPVHLGDEYVYSPRGDCKDSLKYSLEDQQYNSQFAQQIIKEFQPTLLQLSDIFNKTIDMQNIFKLIDTIYQDYLQNNPIPFDIPNSQLWKNLSFLYEFYYADIFYGNTQVIKNLFASPFYNTIQSIIDQKIAGNYTDLKYYAFSGHDSTLGPIFAGINATSIECIYQKFLGQTPTSLNCVYAHPQLASNILIELYQDITTKDYNIQIMINGEYLQLCEKQSIQCSYQVNFKFIIFVNRNFNHEYRHKLWIIIHYASKVIEKIKK